MWSVAAAAAAAQGVVAACAAQGMSVMHWRLAEGGGGITVPGHGESGEEVEGIELK